MITEEMTCSSWSSGTEMMIVQRTHRLWRRRGRRFFDHLMIGEHTSACRKHIRKRWNM